MPQDHRIQSQRFELKYIVREETARMIRDFAGAYLELDEYGAGRPHHSYPVHSLYLDSPSLALYWHTVNGNKNRYKLRIRFYDDQPGSPVFLEIKRRVNNAILKERCAVRREALADVLTGRLPERGMMVSVAEKALVAMQNFNRLLMEQHAAPTALVSYDREAWISPHDNSVRVTMDRRVRCVPERFAQLTLPSGAGPLVFGSHAVLELKFTDRFPDWFAQMVRLFELRQQAAAKYADGIARLGAEHFTHGIGAMTWIPSMPRRES